MQLLPTRRLGVPLAVGAVVLCAAPVAASSASTTGPQKTVTAHIIKRRPGTLAPGSKVSSSALGQRVFVDATHGFALASVGQAQYPAATTDGGSTWKTDGPALHINAAQAPLSVVDLGAASRSTIFAYGTGQVIDTTSDGGKKWYGALFQNGVVMAVVRGSQGHLVAFVDGDTGSSNSAPTWQYVSKNGGRTWSYSTALGG